METIQEQLDRTLAEIQSGTPKNITNITLNPIFSSEIAGKVYKTLYDCWEEEVIKSTGKQPQDRVQFAKYLQNIVYWLCEISKTKRNLIIFGEAGIGKTTIAKALRGVFAKSRFFGKTHSITAKSLGDIYRKRDLNESWDRINSKRTQVLFIDDLGMEEDVVNEYGTKAQPMATLLHNRYDAGLTTIITTNLQRTDFRLKYDERIVDRLNGYCKFMYQRESFRK